MDDIELTILRRMGITFQKESLEAVNTWLFSRVEQRYTSEISKKSQFFEHINKSKMEFLKAIKSLVDEKIEDLEKKDSSKQKKKATKIKVE